MYTAYIYIYIYTKIIWRHSLRRYFGHKRTATIFSFRSRPDFTDRGTRAGDPFRWGECATQQCCQYCWHRKCGRRPWGLGMSFSKLVVGMVFVWKKIIMCFYDFCSVGQHLVGRVLPFAPSQKGGSSFLTPESLRFSCHCRSPNQLSTNVSGLPLAPTTPSVKNSDGKLKVLLIGWYMQPSLY